VAPILLENSQITALERPSSVTVTGFFLKALQDWVLPVPLSP